MYAASLLILSFSLLAAPPQFDLTVAPNGNDANPGTPEKPLATIGKAKELVRGMRSKGLDHDVVVGLRAGTYSPSEPLHFTPADGGDVTHSVTYKAYPNEKVVVSGGIPLTGLKPGADGVWEVTIPEVKSGAWNFRDLYVNGERRPRARFPNEGYLHVDQAGEDKRTNFTASPGDLPKLENADGVELLFLHDWSISRIPVQSIDTKTNTLTTRTPIGCSARHYRIDNFEKHPRYALENARAFLDAPGEWYLDTKTGVLHYLPKPGETLASITMIAPKATQLMDVRGTDKEPVRNLNFVGIEFAYTAWLPPVDGYAEGQAGFFENRISGKPASHPLRTLLPPAIEFAWAENCRLEEVTIAHTGASGIRIGEVCHDNSLIQCSVHDIAGNGIMIGDTQDRRVNGKVWWQAAPEQASRNNLITKCKVVDCGKIYYGSIGIWSGLTHKTTIVDNEITQMPYTGISLGWMWNPTPSPCRENLVQGNHIHHVMQTLSDGGGIYTLGLQPGTRLADNNIHDVPTNAGSAESNGIFCDEGTTDLLIEGNTIRDIARSPLRFHRAGHNVVKGNELFVGPDIPPARFNATDPKNIEMIDNKVIEAKTEEKAEPTPAAKTSGNP